VTLAAPRAHRRAYDAAWPHATRASRPKGAERAVNGTLRVAPRRYAISLRPRRHDRRTKVADQVLDELNAPVGLANTH
jgi:hypothetical protein